MSDSARSKLPILPDEDAGDLPSPASAAGPRSSGGVSVLDRDIRLAELLDLDAFKDVCASFVELYKIGIKIFDSDGTKLVDIRVGNGDWCGYIFQNAVGRQKCTKLVSKIKSFDYPGLRGGKVVQQDCFSGLKYVIMPIMYGGDYLGRVIYGPFRPAELTAPAEEVQSFPDFDPEKLVEETVEVAVQVNGKLRGTVEVAPGAPDGEVTAAARAEENVARYLEEATERRVIVVQDRLVNFVVG